MLNIFKLQTEPIRQQWVEYLSVYRERSECSERLLFWEFLETASTQH